MSSMPQPSPVPWQQAPYAPQLKRTAVPPSGWAWGVAASPLLFLIGGLTAAGAGASANAAAWAGIGAMRLAALICTVKWEPVSAAGS